MELTGKDYFTAASPDEIFSLINTSIITFILFFLNSFTHFSRHSFQTLRILLLYRVTSTNHPSCANQGCKMITTTSKITYGWNF